VINKLPLLLDIGAAPLDYEPIKKDGKIGRGTVEKLGEVDFSGLAGDGKLMFHAENSGPTEMTKPELPPRLKAPSAPLTDSQAWVDAGFGVVMICYQSGPLPSYLNYFLRAARSNAPLIHYIIVHSEVRRRF
jgi:hypothetical protein